MINSAIYYLVDLEPFCHERRILTDQSPGIIKVLSDKLKNSKLHNSNTLNRLNEATKAKLTTKSSKAIVNSQSSATKSKARPLMAFMKKAPRAAKKQVKILYVYNDGLTSGVVKPVLMKDLKF